MRLDSVRDLKNSHPLHLERTFTSRTRGVGTDSTAVASAAARGRVAGSRST